jgi:hypothetical protein
LSSSFPPASCCLHACIWYITYYGRGVNLPGHQAHSVDSGFSLLSDRRMATSKTQEKVKK